MTISKSDHALETLRSLITISIEALKTLVLLNGGAVVAILAYLGQIDDRASVAAGILAPLRWFTLGLFLAAAAFIGSYLTQLSLYNETVHDTKQRHPFILWASMAVALGSLASFALGAFSAVNAFAG